MSTIMTLREITPENWRVVANLSRTLTAEEQDFIADNAYSILEAHYEPDNLFARAIYHEESPVGFVLYGLEPQSGNWWIIRLMVSKPEQGKGYGRAALNAVIDLMRGKTSALYISFMPSNAVGRNLYTSLGFADTGSVEDEEVVYRLTL